MYYFMLISEHLARLLGIRKELDYWLAAWVNTSRLNDVLLPILCFWPTIQRRDYNRIFSTDMK